MAKAEVFKEAQKAGLVPSDAKADDYTENQLLILLGRAPIVGTEMAKKPLVAPDGHENLTQADIDARQ